ncbi:MAG: ABC-type Fe3+/spermidine/putrescine transport system ATPase subunit [Cyclobacteriaceae bacterium]|jgi:iron(III) transport system ATP-binding protein
MAIAIKVKGISKSYDSKKDAVKNISFNVKEGEVIGVLGESGSGKSTLLRLLAGLEDADKGAITISNEVITGPIGNLVPGYDFIRMVYQNFKLQRFKTIRDNVASEIYFLEEDERNKRVDELLELCLLTSKVDSFPHELSGGQQQRVAIALALSMEPEVVLMDEPFSNLDSPMKMIIRQDVISILRNAGVTVLMVSHDHADAMSVADRIMIIENGELVQIDTPQKLYNHPKSEYIANFLGPTNYIKSKGKRKPISIRPEKIKISSNGNHEGVVMETYFQGMHYHNYVKSDSFDQNILLYSESELVIGEKLKFDI